MTAEGAAAEQRLFGNLFSVPEIGTLADWDVAAREMDKFLAETKIARGQILIVDARGRTLGMLADQWSMKEEAGARQEYLRLKAHELAESGDKMAVDSLVAEARSTWRTEMYRATLLGSYSFVMWTLAVHRGNVTRLTKALPESEAAVSLSILHKGEVELADAVWIAMDSDAVAHDSRKQQLTELMQGLYRAYNTERGKLALRVGAKRFEEGSLSATRRRSAPCPEPTGGTSGGESPRLPAQAGKPDYPEAFRRMNFEGRILLQLAVSSTGCVETGEIFHSSGVPELDDAAWKWAERSAFLPAEREGLPVSGIYRMAVSFRLAD